MRKWILVALVGLVLLYVFTLREGVDDTLATTPKCAAPGIDIIDGFCKKPNVPSIPPVCPAGSTLSVGKCRGADSMTAAQAAAAGLTYDSFVNQYVKAAAPTCPAGYTTSFSGAEGECEDVNKTAPVCSSGYVYDMGKCMRPMTGGGSGSPASYATASGYAALAEAAGGGTGQGPLPSAIDARASNTDSPASRPSTGDVFSDSGPFSGNAGTGQGTASGAAGPLNGNSTYGPPGTTTTMDPYDFWPGTKKSGTAPRAPPGTKQPVSGPTFGGTGVSMMSGSGNTTRSEPALYGPGSGSAGGFGWGSMKSNSGDTSMLPSFTSAGSEPENQYAGTSRAPGDQDFYPPTFAQSSSYSLANASMKTDPVPFLTDFSAFQK